jgi:selenocysteine-specific elongation factor
VTGTLWSGSIGRGDELVVLPRGSRARVRGVQVHDAPVARADAGQRVAVNLTGLRVADIARGDVLATPDRAPKPTFRINARLTVKEEPNRVIVHHGTREATAKAVHVKEDVWQLRLEAPLIADENDHIVIRSIAPPDTLGGGTITQTNPKRGPVAGPLAVPRPGTLRSDAGVGRPVPGGEPRSGPSAETLDALEQALKEAGHEPPLDQDSDPETLKVLQAQNRAIRVGRMHFHPEAIQDIENRVRTLCARDGEVTIATLRDELSTTRKYAQALLEHFDAARLTLRVGDVHRLRRGR